MIASPLRSGARRRQAHTPCPPPEPHGALTSRPRRHHLYGIHVQSTMPLDCPISTRPGAADIELCEASASQFDRVPPQQRRPSDTSDWFFRTPLPDGSDYLRWSGLFEFLISADGRRIAYHALTHGSRETLQTYLVSQTLSFALIKQGLEPLHATVVMIGEQAVAILGACGHGKSSLGAAFLQSGSRLLTDDLLVTSHVPGRPNVILAHPGPPRIKLFPKISARLLGTGRSGARMNPYTRKMILPLAHHEHCTKTVPLRACYVLQPPIVHRAPARVTIGPLSPRQACLELIANTFNTIITEPARLARQLDWAARLANTVPVKSLSYPRRLSHIPAVLAAIHKDLAR